MRNGRWRWLMPGMQVKRWLALSSVGLLIALAGLWIGLAGAPAQWLERLYRAIDEPIRQAAATPRAAQAMRWVLGGALILAGLGVWWLGLRRAWRTLVGILQPRASGRVWDVLSRYTLMAHGKRIVVIGGGTGLSTMLRGIKRYTANIVAVVTVTDDGGSSGRLRHELGILPPGDIRNCLIALADAEGAMTALLQHR